MRVLVIEDDSIMAQSIATMLKPEGFVCDLTESGEDGLGLARIFEYDIVILDLMLPDTGGHAVLWQLRAARPATPVIIVSGLAGAEQRVRCLGGGADDYLLKPFDRRELVARIQAVIRRSRGHSQPIVVVGDLKVDLKARTVAVGDTPLRLSGKEYAVLEVLALRKGSAATKDTILNHLYGGLDGPGIKIVDVFVCKLRKKLAAATNGEIYIETVWGHGYKLSECVECQA